MSQEAMRGFARAFCDALATGKLERVAPFLDDDIEWMVFGPVDLFPFFGRRRGKEAVLAMCGEIAASLTFLNCAKESAVSDGENASALVRVTARHERTGRILSLRLAQFAQFRDGKLVSLRALFDSFDFVEQATGRQIELTTMG
jgi:ketosteroid isomerase-like protein